MIPPTSAWRSARLARQQRSLFLNNYGNKAAFGIGQSGERRAAQVDLPTFVDQMPGWAAIGDFNNDAPIRVRYDHPRAEIVKPRCGGEFVGTEPFAIGHRQSAMLLPVP